MDKNSTLVAAFAAALALPAQADDTAASKSAGICGAYKVVAKDERVAEQAMRAAPNIQLAKSYGQDWMRRAKTYGTNAKGEIDQIYAFEGAKACRKIGIAP